MSVVPSLSRARKGGKLHIFCRAEPRRARRGTGALRGHRVMLRREAPSLLLRVSVLCRDFLALRAAHSPRAPRLRGNKPVHHVETYAIALPLQERAKSLAAHP